MRLAKYLAHAGVASRRGAEGLIREGRVAVHGEVVTDPARDVEGGVCVDGKAVAAEEHEVWAVNKPAGMVSTAADTHGRDIVTSLVRSDHRLYPVGRLDADSTGLLLLTNDGELANLLTHPRYEVPKVYRARVEPPHLPERALREMREGVALEDGRTGPAKVRVVEAGLVEVVLREGRKRQVRRMLAAVGHEVTALERVAFGPLRLGDMAPGKARRLDPAEVERLRKSAASDSAV